MIKILQHIFAAAVICGFLLGVKGGYLALWVGDDPQPVQVFPCEVSSLPPADQLLLRKGIPVSDPIELAHLLEDYS